MSKVWGKIPAGTAVELEASKVADVISSMNLEGNYTAVVNGEPQDTSYILSEGDFVVLAKSVKGGKRVVLLNLESIKVVKDGAKIWVNGQLVTRAQAKKLFVTLGTLLGYDIA